MFKRFLADIRGAAAIEMAFVLLPFLMAVFAVIEFSVIFFFSFVLESAMYNVTRFVKVQLDPAAVQQQVRDKINELSFGLMRDDKVIITTDLNINFAEDWQNAAPEQCTNSAGTVIAGQDCANTGGCGGQFLDDNDDQKCNIGPPALDLESPGSIVQYTAFYKKPILTPLFCFLETEAGTCEFLVRSSTVVRNEPQ